MAKLDILERSLSEWSEALTRGEVTSRFLTETCFDRIERYDRKLKVFTVLLHGAALREANLADKRRSRGVALGPLDGIPVAVKDNIEVTGTIAAAGMASRKAIISTEDAAVVSLLHSSGAVIMGKVNMHEAALGSTNENPLYGRTYNPHKSGFTPGGSSGGSGAAVAAGFCLMTLGTDTLGSIRIPAAYCGVAGIKPTTGLVSTRGIVPLSWSFDTVGPLTPKVQDLGLVLEAIAGFDPECTESRQSPASYRFAPDSQPNLVDVKLGRLANVDSWNVHPDMQGAFEAAVKDLAGAGAKIIEVYLPNYDFTRARRDSLVIVEAEGSVVHSEDLEKCPEKLSEDLVSLLKYGREVNVSRLIGVQRKIAKFAKDLRKILNDVDAIVLPTTPQPAFEFGKTVTSQADFTVLANLMQGPAVSVPMGFSTDRLPLGLQFIGRPWGDKKILTIASAYEKMVGHKMRVQNLI